MVGARFALGVLALAAAGTAIVPTAVADCHYSWTGCMPCPDNTDCDSDVIGTLAGVLVSGDADEGEAEEPALTAAVVQAQGGGRAGHVLLHFARANGSDPVPLSIRFSGNVEWPGATQDNFTFQTNESRAYEFHIRGSGHRHIPFRIVAHEDTAGEEVLEGVFTVEQPPRGGFTPWPLVPGVAALAAVAALRRRRG